MLKSTVLAYDAAINQNGLNVSDNQLINILSNNDIRLKALLDNHYDGKMISDFRALTNEILDLETKVKSIISQNKFLTDKEERSITAEEKNQLEKFNIEKADLLKKYEEKRIEAEDFKNGNKSLYYIKQFLFGVNDFINSPFVNTNFDSWLYGVTGKNVSDLTKSQVDDFRKKYQQYTAGSKTDNIQTALDIFDKFNMEYSNSLQGNEQTYQNVMNLRHDLFDEMYQTSEDGNPLVSQEGDFLLKPDFQFVNEDYITSLRDEVTELTNQGKIDEANEKQKEIDESVTNNENVINNVNTLIDTIVKNYGYIDADSIKMIRKLFLSKSDIMKSLLSHNKLVNSLKLSDLDKLINDSLISNDKGKVDEVKKSIIENAIKEYNENKNNEITETVDRKLSETVNDAKNNAVIKSTICESVKNNTNFKLTSDSEINNPVSMAGESISLISNYSTITQIDSIPGVHIKIKEIKYNNYIEGTNDNNIDETSANKVDVKNVVVSEDGVYSFSQKIYVDVSFDDETKIGYSAVYSNSIEIEGGLLSMGSKISLSDKIEPNKEQAIDIASNELQDKLDVAVSDLVDDYTVKSKQLISINSLNEKIASAKTNPLYELMRKFAIDNTGKKINVIDFLEEQDKQLENNEGVSNYILSDDSFNDIKRAQDILKLMSSVIIASSNEEANPFAFNTILNKYINDHSLQEQNKNLYGVIAPTLSTQLIEEVTKINIRLEALKRLSLNNQMNKFKQLMVTGEKIDAEKLSFYKQSSLSALTNGIDFSKYNSN